MSFRFRSWAVGMATVCLVVAGCATEPEPVVPPPDEAPAPAVEAPPEPEQETVTLSEQAQAAVAMVEALDGRVQYDPQGRVIGVDLTAQSVSDEEVEPLQALTDLEVLALRGAEISDAALAVITGLRRPSRL